MNRYEHEPVFLEPSPETWGNDPQSRILPRALTMNRTDIKNIETFRCMIDKTWNGLPVTEHDPFHVEMRWHFERQIGKPHKRVVKCQVKGPLFDDPPEPDDYPGYCDNLYEYECVELFFANDNNQYLEVEIGPHGHWLAILHEDIRKAFNKGEELDVEVTNKFEGNTWVTNFEVPLAWFPPKLTKFNCFSLHGSGDDRHYECWAPVTDGSETEPDFHRLQYYKKIDYSRLIPRYQNPEEANQEEAFKDWRWGNLWEHEAYDEI